MYGRGSKVYVGEDWAKRLTHSATTGLNMLYKAGEFHSGTECRLAFREFGTVLGVKCHPGCVAPEWQTRVQNLAEFWETRLYTRDQDITPVMYCAGLIPGMWKKETKGGTHE